MNSDEKWMRAALREAARAASQGEVPVGAIVVQDGRIVGRNRNQVERKRDATAHAEILALRQASRKLKQWRLTGCTLYVTLEPCAMCAGALVQSRIDRLVFACRDPKFGGCGSVFNIPKEKRLNHRVEIKGGVLDEESRGLLVGFFQERRNAERWPSG